MIAWLRFQLWGMALLVVSGGWIFRASGKSLELSSLDPFAALFLLSGGVAWFLGDRTRIRGALEGVEAGLRQKPRVAWAWVGALAFFSFLLLLGHWFKHLSFATDLFDAGLVHQGLFHPFASEGGGVPLRSSLEPRGSYLVDHLALTFLGVAPLLSWLQSDVAVFTLQVACLALGVAVLIRRGPLVDLAPAWFWAALILLSQRTLRAAAVFDFREEVLAFPALCAALVALSLRRPFLFALALGAYVASKEHLALVAFGVLIPILFDRELGWSPRTRLRWAVSTGLGLGLYAIFVFRFVLPTLQAGLAGVSNFAARLGVFGETPERILAHAMAHPWDTFTQVVSVLGGRAFEKSALRYLVFLLGPALYFLRFSWSWLLAAGIGILGNLLAAAPTQRMMEFHYDLSFLAFLFWGTLQGIRVVWDTSPDTPRSGFRWGRSMAVGLFLAIALSGRWPGLKVWENWPSLASIQDSRFLGALQCSVEAPVAGGSRVLAQLAHCPSIRLLTLPETCSDASGERSVRSAWASQPKSDTSRIPGQSVFESRVVVLDRKRPCEASLEKVWPELRPGTRVPVSVRESPSGRFVVLQ